MRPSTPKPRPSIATPMTSPSIRLSAMQLATCAWWCWTPTLLETVVERERVLRREVFGVQVVRDDVGAQLKEPLEVLDALLVRAQRLEVLKVADVVTHEGVVGRARGRRCSSAPRRRRGSLART